MKMSPTATSAVAEVDEKEYSAHAEADLEPVHSTLKLAFRALSLLQRDLLLSLHHRRTNVPEFAAQRAIRASTVRRELRAALLALAQAGTEKAVPERGRVSWDEQRRALLSALASAEVVMDAERRALELIVSRGSLTEVLDVLTTAVEECCGTDSVAAILVTDSARKRLFTGSAPTLPAEYCAAIDGIEISPDVGTCCAAAATKSAVITIDIARDPRWAGLSHLPLALGLKGAWSQPILGTDDVVLGTFGTYFRTTRKPSPAEVAVVTVLSHIAAIAIERETREADSEQDRGELRTANRELSDVNDSMDEFVSLISHELLTPLTILEGNLRHVRNRDYSDQLAGEMLADAHETAVRMTRIVNGLVLVARNGHQPVDGLEPLRVGAAVSSICDSVRTPANEIDLALAPSSYDDIVIGSVDYLQQIITNLVSNAAKYGQPGDPIVVTVRTDLVAVHVTVADRGPGIPEAERPLVFERYFRGRQEQSARGGLGVGLAVCKRLAEAMNGIISFQPRDGGGSEFILELPRAEVPLT